MLRTSELEKVRTSPGFYIHDHEIRFFSGDLSSRVLNHDNPFYAQNGTYRFEHVSDFGHGLARFEPTLAECGTQGIHLYPDHVSIFTSQFESLFYPISCLEMKDGVPTEEFTPIIDMSFWQYDILMEGFKKLDLQLLNSYESIRARQLEEDIQKGLDFYSGTPSDELLKPFPTLVSAVHELIAKYKHALRD